MSDKCHLHTARSTEHSQFSARDKHSLRSQHLKHTIDKVALATARRSFADLPAGKDLLEPAPLKSFGKVTKEQATLPRRHYTHEAKSGIAKAVLKRAHLDPKPSPLASRSVVERLVDTAHQVSKLKDPAKISRVKEIVADNLKKVASGDIQTEGDIFSRFLSLMTRILWQEEGDADELYHKIKRQTDDGDALRSLIGEFNRANGPINWENDQIKKDLLDRVRKIPGVNIPAGKYAFTLDEIVAERETLKMMREDVDKITLQDRNKMQRFMQNITQCHQSMSNVSKLEHDTKQAVIHNIK